MKRLSIVAVILTIVALASFALAQCQSESKEVKVMCLTGDGPGASWCQMNAGNCCSGMEHGCMCSQCQGQHEMGGCEKHFFLCCAEEMELDEAQTKRLKEIRLEHQKATIRSKANLEIMELELKELLQQASPDRAVIGKKIADMGELKTTMKKNEVMARLDARTVLSKEQLEKCMKGHCGCCGMGAKEVIMEHAPCSGSSSPESKECSGKCK